MRARITFSKRGALRYIGHLDLQTLWERAARRAGLALAYSHGFHPQPKINFASALPLGFSSRAQIAAWADAHRGIVLGVFRQPGGSNVIFRHINGAMLSVPAHRPIKPIYIRKFIRLIESGVSE